MVFEVVLFALVLSTDSFSAALAMGARSFSFKRATFFAFSSGLSEGFATLIGYRLGASFAGLLAHGVHWLAFAALWLVGLHMIYHAVKDLKSGVERTEEVRGHGSLKILLISIITSFDALGVGVSLGAVNKPIVFYSLVIGLFAVLATYAGLFLAKKLKFHWGESIEIFGGFILLGLGVKFLLG